MVSVSMAAMPTCRHGKLAGCKLAVHCGLVRAAVLASLALFSITATAHALAGCLWSSLSTPPLCVVCEGGLRSLVALGPGPVLVAVDERGMAVKATTARSRYLLVL